MRLIVPRLLAGAVAAGAVIGALLAQAQEPPPPDAPRAGTRPDAAATPAAPPAPSESPAPASQKTGAPRAVTGRIRGTVFGPAHQPLAGLLVQLMARGEAGLLRITSTNERGEYVFADLPAGGYDVEVGSGGFARQTKSNIAVRPPFRNIVDFDLVGGGIGGAGSGAAAPESAGSAIDAAASPVVVRGTLFDQDKRPVSEVSVIFAALDGRGIHQAFSSPDGTFNIPGVPPGRYRVVVSSPGYVGLDLKDIGVPAGTGLNLQLSMVDYPLNFKGRGDEDLPREEPRPLPTPAASPTPAAPAVPQPVTPAATPEAAPASAPPPMPTPPPAPAATPRG